MRLRLATFNLESLDDRPRLDPPLEARIEVLRPQLLRLDADILCLQEIHGQRAGRGPRELLALRRLIEGTPYAAFHVASTKSAGRHAGPAWVADVHNLVVLSRWPFLAQEQLHADLVEPPSYRPVGQSGEAQPVLWERALLRVSVALSGSRLLQLIALHLRSPLASALPGQKEDAFSWRSVPGWAEGFFLSAVKRAGQALEARLLIDRLFDADPGALVAVVGDLNAEDREMPLRLLAAETSDTGNGALTARTLVPLARSIAADRRFSVVHGGRRVMLDHILVSLPLLAALRQVECHNEMLADEARVAAAVRHPTASSHAPVVAEFLL